MQRIDPVTVDLHCELARMGKGKRDRSPAMTGRMPAESGSTVTAVTGSCAVTVTCTVPVKSKLANDVSAVLAIDGQIRELLALLRGQRTDARGINGHGRFFDLARRTRC